MEQLEDLEGENAGLDSLLESKKEELRQNKEYIASILSKQNASVAELREARSMIAQLTSQRKSLEQAVDSLKSLNIELERDNIALLQEKEIIKHTLDSVAEDASRLEIENIDLLKERDLASILSTNNIEAKGIKIKGQDKESDAKRASATDKIKICFDLLENKIAKEGPTPIHIRLIGPNGTTMALQALGSGTFEDATNGTEMQYTYKISPNFEKEGKSVCSYWDQNTAYASGDYKVEVYQNGYLIGTSGFSLK